MATYLNPKTGATIGYQETKGTTAEPFFVPMAWQPSTLSYVTLSLDAAGNLLVSGGGGGGGAVTIADGANVAQGSTTDVAITTDINGTISGKLRGLVKIFGSVWDSVNNRLNVAVGISTYLPQSGTVSSSGNTVIHTPAAGKTIQMFYYMLNADANNSTPVTATIRFSSGSAITTISLPPGGTIARNIGAGKYYFAGAVNDTLIINLSAGANVNFALEYLEV